MTCIKNVNRLDRLILGARDPDEAHRRAHLPACRLLVERLKWATLLTILVAVAGVGLMLYSQARQGSHARQQLADIVANDCVDRPGDIAFRNVLADLVRINEEAMEEVGGRRPTPAETRQRTIRVLREGLKDAGPVPHCILRNVP